MVISSADTKTRGFEVKSQIIHYSALFYLLQVLAGCSATTTIDEYRPSAEPIPINNGEKIVLLGRRDAGHYETDNEFIHCVAKHLKNVEIQVLDQQQFIDAIYPWFEPRTAPKSLARLKRLLQQPLVMTEIDRLSVRYLVWIDGLTETQEKSGSISCAIGPSGGGCLGYTQWSKLSNYESTVWDLQLLEEKGRLRVDSEGTSYLIGAIAPIPLLTPVKNDACNSMGSQLKLFFSTQ
jgi:hypothetical protein